MIESVKKYKDWKIYCIFVILFVFATAFINDMRVYYDVIGIIFFDFVLIRRKIKLDWGDVLIILGTFVYRISDNPDLMAAVMETLKMFALYQIAKYIADPSDNNDTVNETDISNWISFVVLLLSFVLFIRGLMSYSYVLTDSTVFREGKWYEWKPKWSLEDLDTNSISHISHQFYLVLMGSILPLFVIKAGKNKMIGTIGIILSLTAIWMGTLTVGGLTPVCSFVAFLVVFIVYVSEKKLYKNLRFWVYICAVIDTITAIMLAIRQNLFGMGNWYRNSIWSAADSFFYTSRFTLMGQALELLPEYPFGGYDYKLTITNVATEYSAYNSWIDIGVDEGIIPLVLYLGFLIICILALISVCRKSKGIGKYTLVAAFTGMTMYNMFAAAFYNYRYWNVEIFLAGLVWGLYANVSGKRGIEISFDKIREKYIGFINDREIQKQ